MRIFGIAGKAGSGKDTVYKQMEELLTERGYNVTKLSFASRLKDVCVLMFGWDRERLEHDFAYKEGNTLDDGSIDPACEMLGMTRREVMQKLGTEAMRNGLHQHVWVIALRLAILRGEYDSYDIGVLTDCRFLNEIGFVKQMGGHLIQVERSGAGTLTDKVDHASETEWLQWREWDAIIQNNPSSEFVQISLDELKKNVERQILVPFVDGYKTDQELAQDAKDFARDYPMDISAFRDYISPEDFKRKFGI